ncbi:MAG: hypothetical protein CSA84_01845 [Actinomycetales bacterium]|nr:MAG: hypothetical protein CSA84_01845 [Actinomycetales bacterium]
MFDDSAWLLWLGLALGLGIIETLTVDFTFLMLAGGALGGAGAAALGLPFPGQVIAAAVLAVALVAIVRPWAQRKFAARGGHPEIGTAAHVGRSARVIETVTATGGRIRLDGDVWTSRVDDTDVLAPGEAVRVIRIEGATAIVIRRDTPIDQS